MRGKEMYNFNNRDNPISNVFLKFDFKNRSFLIVSSSDFWKLQKECKYSASILPTSNSIFLV
jgi:hypothetical protein